MLDAVEGMAAPGLTDETAVSCAAFFAVPAAEASLTRFLVGDDEEPQPMEAAELEAELNDAFALNVLRKGVFPSHAQGVLDALDAAIGANHPLAVTTQRSFVVAEGSQAAKDPKRSFQRRLRFLVTRGQGVNGPDLLISTFQAGSRSAEVMAWDDRVGGFNYYRTLTREGAAGSWVWAGNSRHAWEPGTRANGPFEAHPTGNFIFKEFKLPWLHWHGPPAIIDELDLPEGDDTAAHPWFERRMGAYVLEDSVARPAIKRWNRRRLTQVIEAGAISDVVQVIERIVGSPEARRATVNLVSSRDSNEEVKTVEVVRLPVTFFVDFDTLTEVLGLAGPQAQFTVAGSHYRDALTEFEVVLRNQDQARPLNGEEAFERPGDTHFVFVVPERAFEDTDFVRQLVKPETASGEPALGLVSERLLGCLLMVDFPNPVFSQRRTKLLDHVRALVGDEPLSADRWPAFSEELGNRIAAAATGAPESAAEDEFGALWALGDEWRSAANELLVAYYQSVRTQLESREGFFEVFKAAEARRQRVRGMPIDETPLLFAQTNIPAESLEGLAMNRNATVESRATG